MKKIILTVLMFVTVSLSQPVFAVSVRVASLEDFTTETPSKTLKVITLEQAELKEGMVLPEGSVIKGEIFDVRPPTRGKRNATFKFKPLYYSNNGQKVEINSEEIIAKYAPYKPLDKGELATSAVSTAGGFILKIPGWSQAVSFTKGFAKDQDGHRVKSGVVQVYKDSPLSYIEEGKEVVLKKDQLFVLKFKIHDEEDEQTANEPADSAPSENQTTNVNNTVPKPTPPNVNEPPQENAPVKQIDPYEVLKEVEQSKAKP